MSIQKIVRSIDLVIEPKIALHGNRTLGFFGIFAGGKKPLERQRIEPEPDLNGVTIADPEGKLYSAMIEIAEKRLEKNGLATLLPELAR